MKFSGIKLNVIEGSEDCKSIKTLYTDNSFFFMLLYYKQTHVIFYNIRFPQFK